MPDIITLGIFMLNLATNTTGLTSGVKISANKRKDGFSDCYSFGGYNIVGLDNLKTSKFETIKGVFQEKLNSSLVHSTINKFEIQLNKRSDIAEIHKQSLEAYFYNALNKIVDQNPISIILSLTDSDSIYFRFYNTLSSETHINNFETHLEVFYLNEADDIEVVCNVYKNETVVLKTFGHLEEVFNTLSKILSYDYNTASSIDREVNILQAV